MPMRISSQKLLRGLLIQTEATHDLKVIQDNQVTNPAAKMMYATVLVSVITGKNCCVPTGEGY